MPKSKSAVSDISPMIPNRRRTSRFPIQQDVRYKLPQEKTPNFSAGTTINIGSNGVLFTTDRSLPLGGMVEVSVNWPARLDGTCALKFVASGPVVRSDGGQTAMRIKRYEFRTRSTRAN
jgi:hypothetical protein